jgi:tRNA pseudouridine38-40 synthase
MNRYFLEVAYKGTKYSGFQVQENAMTIQSEVEHALALYFRSAFRLTGSSRTDAGVHALQNYFHFDSDQILADKALYNINAILPEDIVVKSLSLMPAKPDGNPPHARFDALSRQYKYFVQQKKDPFTRESSYYFPYSLDLELLHKAACLISGYSDFTSFSKRNTQVKNFICKIEESKWVEENGMLQYRVKSNRFLRGMVRALVGTMLQVGRNKISLERFQQIIDARDCSLADFSAAAEGLFLVAVDYPENFFAQNPGSASI